MEFKNKKMEKEWIEGLKINQDSYGRAVYDYAETWAEMMEKQMKEDKKIEDVAKKTSHDSDTDGITGFMYGCAVSLLASTWKHGEQLRIWHNLDTQIGNEGEVANKKGTTLNPALLNVEIKE